MKKTRKKHPRKPGRPALPRLLRVPVPVDRPDLAPLQMLDTEAARVCGCSLRTVARWRAAGIGCPTALALLQAHAYGLLPHRAWQGWHLDRDGFLMAPGLRRGMAPAHVLAAALAFDQVADLRRRVAALTAQLEAAGKIHAADAAANDPHPGQLALPLRPPLRLAKETPRQLPAGGFPPGDSPTGEGRAIGGPLQGVG